MAVKLLGLIKPNKKRIIMLCVIITLSFIIEIFVCNYKYWFRKIDDIFQGYETRDYNITDVITKDLSLQPDGSYISTSNDSWLEIKGLQCSVNNIIIDMSFSSDSIVSQVFWSADVTQNYAETNSCTMQFDKKEKNRYEFVLNLPQEIDSLRIDLVNTPNERLILNHIRINDNTLYIPDININRLIALFFAVCLVFFLAFGDENKLKFVVQWRYAIFSSLFLVMVAFQINFSSISYWDNLFADRIEQKQDIIIGTYRPIRSDEWLVGSPYTLSQSMNEQFYPVINKNIRSDGQNMTLASSLAFDWTIVAKPALWGYLLFGRDYGFSWSNCFILISMLVSSLEMCLLLTKRNIRLSLLGSLWITFSPAVQWWTSIPAISWMQFSIICIAYYLQCSEQQKLKKGLIAIALAISGSAFIIAFYPAWQVPLGYLALIFIIYIFISNRKKFKFRVFDVGMVLGICAFVVSIIAVYFINVRDALAIVSNTVYPGARFETGGHYNLFMILKDAVSLRLPFKDQIPAMLENQSEVSSFISFLPFVLLAFPFIIRKDKSIRVLSITLVSYLALMLSWLLVTYPDIVAKITLFSNVPPDRLMVPIGITSLYICIMFVNSIQAQKVLGRINTIWIGAVTGLAYIFAITNTDMYQYLGLKFTILIILLYVLIVLSIGLNWKKTFTLLMSSLILTCGLTVNPVVHGTGPIYNKKASQDIATIRSAEPDAKWIGLGNLLYGQYLIANGVHSLNSVHFYPDLNLWKKLDTTGEYNNVYNRYAHVIISLTNEKTTFTSPQADVVILNLNINDLSKLDVKYILSSGDLTPFNSSSMVFHQVIHNTRDNYYIFSLEIKKKN